jgi:hypothetical protein
LKVEKYSDQEIVIHIAVDEAKIKNPTSEGGISKRVGHLPLNRQALEKSGLKIKKEQGEIPSFTQGYQQWRQAFDQGKAGVFSIPVSEAVNYIEQAMNNQEK